MKLSFEEAMPAYEVGQEIAGHLESGVDYIHVEHLPFGSMEDLQRDEYVTQLSGAVGRLTLTGDRPGTELWELNSATSPNASFIPYHTDNPFLDDPEQIVSFWNLRSSKEGGENLIISASYFLEVLDEDPAKRELLQDLVANSVNFSLGGKMACGPIIDPQSALVRYDQKYISPEHAELGTRLTKELNAAGFLARSVKLAAGGVLFLNNRTTFHARAPYSDPNRLSIRVRIVPEENRWPTSQ